MKRLRNGFVALVAAGLALGLAACGGDATTASSDSPQVTSSPTLASTPVEQVDLMVYSGAGLKKPMEQVKVEFEAANPGVSVVYTYAGSAQLLAQIESSGKGDVFVPGSQDSYDVANQKGLAGPAELIAHHTPAIGVAKGTLLTPRVHKSRPHGDCTRSAAGSQSTWVRQPSAFTASPSTTPYWTSNSSALP